MSVRLESIQPGKCYLVEDTRGFRSRRAMRLVYVRRVVCLTPDGWVQYESRTGRAVKEWQPGMLRLNDFASQASREVPSDWTPYADKGKP